MGFDRQASRTVETSISPRSHMKALPLGGFSLRHVARYWTRADVTVQTNLHVNELSMNPSPPGSFTLKRIIH